MKHSFPVAFDGFPAIAIGLVLTVMAAFIHPLAVILPGLLTLFFIYFFRNPKRDGPDMPDCLVSPADGRVMAVSTIDHDPFLESSAVRVSIFLSLTNVHVNRSPMNGRVKQVLYRPGKFLPAFKSHASEINERNTVIIEGDSTTIAVHQITGFIARRIVCDVKPGDLLHQRQRFGMIRFGSCTELILPPGFNVAVREGDKVKGGITVLARKVLSGQPDHPSGD